MGYYKNTFGNDKNSFEDDGLDLLKTWVVLGGLALLLVSLFTLYSVVNLDGYFGRYVILGSLFKTALFSVILLVMTIFAKKSDSFLVIFLVMLVFGSLLLIFSPPHQPMFFLISSISIATYSIVCALLALKYHNSKTTASIPKIFPEHS